MSIGAYCTGVWVRKALLHSSSVWYYINNMCSSSSSNMRLWWLVRGEGFCKYFSIIRHVNQRFKDALAQHQSACAAGRPSSPVWEGGEGLDTVVKVCPHFPSLLLRSQLRPITLRMCQTSQPAAHHQLFTFSSMVLRSRLRRRSKLKPATHQLHITLAFHYRHSTAHPHQFAWRWGGGVGKQANICIRGNRERKRWAIIEAAATVPNYNRSSSSSSISSSISSKKALSTVQPLPHNIHTLPFPPQGSTVKLAPVDHTTRF